MTAAGPMVKAMRLAGLLTRRPAEFLDRVEGLLEARLDQLFGGELAFADLLRRLRRRQAHLAYITLGSHSPICGHV